MPSEVQSALLSWYVFICVSKLNIICSDNCFSACRLQAIIWTNAGMFLIRTLETKISDNLSEIRRFSLKMHFKMSSVKWRQICLGVNVACSRKNITHAGHLLSWLHVYCVFYTVLSIVQLFIFLLTPDEMDFI